MSLVVNAETYSRFIFVPNEELDEEVGLAEFELRIAEGQLATAETDAAVNAANKAIEDAKAELKQAQEDRNQKAEKVTVTYRPLRARDKAELEDSVRMNDDDGRQIRPGEMKRLSILRAVQKWDYETPWTENILDNLHPSAYEAIYAWISWGVEPPKQDQETGDPLERPERTPNRAERRATEKVDRKKTPKAEAPKDEELAKTLEPVGAES